METKPCYKCGADREDPEQGDPLCDKCRQEASGGYLCICGHESEYGVICGGSEPWATHGRGSEHENIYFLLHLPSGDMTTTLHSEVPFELTEPDWAAMFEHAACGCVAEPQCVKCLEYLSLKGM